MRPWIIAAVLGLLTASPARKSGVVDRKKTPPTQSLWEGFLGGHSGADLGGSGPFVKLTQRRQQQFRRQAARSWGDGHGGAG
jgi:hypothetical protein